MEPSQQRMGTAAQRLRGLCGRYKGAYSSLVHWPTCQSLVGWGVSLMNWTPRVHRPFKTVPSACDIK